MTPPIAATREVYSFCVANAATRNDGDGTRRTIIMRKNLSIALTLLVLIGAAPLLGACHTTAGAGQDISATGNVITHDAKKLTP